MSAIRVHIDKSISKNNKSINIKVITKRVPEDIETPIHLFFDGDRTPFKKVDEKGLKNYISSVNRFIPKNLKE